jgi:hypothetical protein
MSKSNIKKFIIFTLVIIFIIIIILLFKKKIDGFTDPPSGTPTGTTTGTTAGTPTGTPFGTTSGTPFGTPTETPTQSPTEFPTQSPTEFPTQAPTEAPTQSPTQAPTEAPTEAPVSYTPEITITPPALHSIPTPTLGNFGMRPNGMGGLNISQNGGDGYNNYFTPNIFIKRKNNMNDSQTQRVEFGLGKELHPFLNALNPNGMTQTATDLIYDNTGYNLGNYSSGSGGVNYTSDGGVNYTSDGGVNYTSDGGASGASASGASASGASASGASDPFNTAERNARLSYQREQEQAGTCLECNETDSGLDYSGTVDNFTNTTDKNNNFTHSCKMKKFRPGYQLQPPTCWDVPQKRPPVCLSDKKCLPAAVFDNGLSLNALQFDTAVGSIMPGFTYVEHPRS